MKPQVYFGIAIRIILLFAVGIAMTFVTPHMRTFFNDTPHIGMATTVMDEDWDWGIRHYWFHFMLILLFALSAINIMVGIINLVDKHYK